MRTAMIVMTVLASLGAGCATSPHPSLARAQATARFERAADAASMQREGGDPGSFEPATVQFCVWIRKPAQLCADAPHGGECGTRGWSDGEEAEGKEALADCARSLAARYLRPSPERAIELVRQCMDAKGFDRAPGMLVKANFQ